MQGNTTHPVTPTDTVAAPTRDQLELAYRNLWHHGWPATLDDALARPGYKAAILGVARNMHRRVTSTGTLHTLPNLPAPPVQTPARPTGARKYGRSEFSIAKGPTTALTSFARPHPLGVLNKPGTNPTSKPNGNPTTKRFDARKAAANDLDD